MSEEKRKQRWGRQEPGSSRWWKRYDGLIRDGFVHDEASLMAEGKISTPAMLKARRARRRYYGKVEGMKMTKDEYQKAVDDLYDEKDWVDEYEQVYPEDYIMG